VGTGNPRDPRDVAAELQALLLGSDEIESFLAEVARSAVGAVDGELSCGLTVGATRFGPPVGATTDAFAAALDRIQYDVDDGPCLTCLRTATEIAVDDIATDVRWPAFARRGRQEGVGSSLSVPLVVTGRGVGALNLYSRRAGGLPEPDRFRARQFAGQAAGAVALALRLREREERAQHLETALRSRSTIDQALGVLVAQLAITPDEAFDLLRKRSQHTNRKLRDIAARVIEEAAQRRP